MVNSKQTPLRAGILGAGLMGRWHAEYAQRAGARIVAIGDQDISLAKSLSGRFRADTFAGLDDMLEHAGLDVLHVCTPLASHCSLALRAIRAGVHVFIEKPLAESAQETRMLLDEADRSGVLICPVHQFGFQDGVLRAAKGLVAAGEILQARFTICSAGGDGQSGLMLDRIVADILPHPLSVLRVIWPGISLSSEGWSILHPRDGELHISGTAGDIGLAMYISMNARPTRCELDLFGSRGHIHVNFFHGYAVSGKGEVSRTRKILQPFLQTGNELRTAGTNIALRGMRREPAYPGLPRLISQFYAAIGQGEKGPIPAEDILAVATARDELVGAAFPGVASPVTGGGGENHD